MLMFGKITILKKLKREMPNLLKFLIRLPDGITSRNISVRAQKFGPGGFNQNRIDKSSLSRSDQKLPMEPHACPFTQY